MDGRPLLERLEAGFIPEPMSGCWLWVKASHERGYGVLGWRGKLLRAHRASYMLFKGPIPAGLVVRHSCDTPACVNPDHLTLGTQSDNLNDAVRRGRQKPGPGLPRGYKFQ